MGNGSSISVDINVLSDTSEKFLLISNEMSSLFDDIKCINSELDTKQIWNGKSHDFFDKNFDLLTDNFENISSCLYSTARFLNDTATAYENAKLLYSKK